MCAKKVNVVAAALLLVSLVGNDTVLSSENVHGTGGKSNLVHAAGDCPTGSEKEKQAVEAFLTGERWASERSELGIGQIDPSQIQTLSDPGDASVCQEIGTDVLDSESIPVRYRVAYYRAGDYYFISYSFASSEDSDESNIGLLPLIILDSDLNVKQGYLR
jgi:hypothetical protein